MIPATSCPPREDLERLLDERLAPAEQQRLSRHVAGCAACQKALEALTADSGWDMVSDQAPTSWREGSCGGSSSDPPDFLDRMKQAPPRPHARPAAGADGSPRPPSDGAVMLTDDGAAEPLPQLADYEILGVLGRGGEGVVYQARHRPLGRVVALKMLRYAEQADPPTLLRFRMEAETLARLRHPNIVQVYEVGSAGGRPFFAMEHVEGGTLSGRLNGQPPPARDAAALMEAAARAVHAAHQAGVVHRDLKPGNILLTWAPDGSFGTPKIGDFGLAKRVQVDSSLTRSGAVLGTPGYMAPEQARAGAKEVGPACDIYSLGSILYHLLTGRPPFVGARPMDVLLQVVHDEPVSVRRLFPQAPRDLETICLKCLHKDPRRRYATAEALADDLRRYRDGRPVLARPTPSWERAWKAARRRPVVATLATACTTALLLLLGGAAYYNAQLSAALKQSDAAEKKEAEEAQEAKRQQELALDAYRNLVFDVQDSMSRKPGLIELKKKLLQTAAMGLKAVAQGDKSQARDRTQTEAHYRLAMLFGEAEDLADAEQQLELSR
ncbi:MAG TPA: protein kinase, partial [Gemmataceae bacterium]|nr:protein kinase [Gemmataceae bacterium]